MTKIFTFSLFLVIITHPSIGAQSFWQPAQEANFRSADMERLIIPNIYKTTFLDLNGLQAYLQNAPVQQWNAAQRTSYLLELPTPDGKMETFNVWKSPVMHPDLAARYPEIQTYAGRSMEDPTASIRFDVTPHGFHAMIMGAERTIFIDPYARQETEHYIVYHKKDFTTDKKFHCALEEVNEQPNLQIDPTNPLPEEIKKEESQQRMATYCSEAVTLRTYRAAVACTGEFGQFHGGTVPLALAAIVTTMNRVNSVYEKDLAIHMELISNNDAIVFVNPLLDPFLGNDEATVLLVESQVQIDARIMPENYDIGHTVSTGAGGVAFLGVICTNQKAGGITGTRNPIGDPFDIDYVSHEMGHQFGGSHTFNGSMGSCGGNGGSDTAFEPGSGSTIQAYAGICGAENLQPNSDPYFHVASLEEMGMYSRMDDGNDCPVQTATNNTGPQILSATSGFTIPASTPFEMTATASDPDGDELTYCWEQYDLGPTTTIDNPNVTSGPIFRSFNPTLNPTRTFPRLSDLVINTTVIGEVLPAVSRQLKFRLTVRDNGTNSNNVGGLCFDDFSISVDGNSGPLLVNYPNGLETWVGNTQETVTWNVANTNLAPVNCTQVDVLLSVDGGFTYPFLLADDVANTGMAVVNVPSGVNTGAARIKVKAANNIFFDISNQDFLIDNGGLSLEWLAFEAVVQKNSIQLDWSTALEVDNLGFEIQRATSEEDDFQKIAWVDAKKERENTNRYKWQDHEVRPNEVYYYRLKQVDTHGKTDFSKVVTAHLQHSNGVAEAILSPNPAQDKLEIKALGFEKFPLDVELYEWNGRLLQTYILSSTAETFDFSAFPAGIYVLKIGNQTQQVVKRLVIE